jgi:23S rRNA (cytosine1962-C5)-methyltransferase
VNPIQAEKPILPLLKKAGAARAALIDPGHRGAFRLFNGFTEGCPDLVVDVYARTAVLYNYAAIPEEGQPLVEAARTFLQETFPWLKAAVVKTRSSPLNGERWGKILFGQEPDRRVQEHGAWYALDLGMNQDASLYLDTRNLRKWLMDHMHGKTVLNTFAYTGSLGAAACAGGAQRVVQLDLNRTFLNLAKTTYTLNGFPIRKADFIVGDFWAQVGRFKRSGERFDIVLVDPPFFSSNPRGTLDLNTDSARLINKVRPLINDGGWLVAINNALYVSGREYMQTLEALCADGYLKIAELISVPEDCAGYAATRTTAPLTDPSPFSHSTKIAVLAVRRTLVI